MRETTAEMADPGSAHERGPRFLSGIRSRMLLWYIALLAVAVTTSVLVIHRILTLRVDEQIDADLYQESREISVLAGGIDPRTGERFRDDVERIFEVFLSRNIPHENEVYLTFVDGEPHLRRPQEAAYRLDRDPRLVELWNDVDTPQRGRAETPGGEVEYLALPLRAQGR
ncbi:MAG TPA: hypothetical protein VHL78_01025, partial [Actinomycetota bacterium]|nr:hypothetical protein [Actinomycetota bacterium]